MPFRALSVVPVNQDVLDRQFAPYTCFVTLGQDVLDYRFAPYTSFTNLGQQPNAVQSAIYRVYGAGSMPQRTVVMHSIRVVFGAWSSTTPWLRTASRSSLKQGVVHHSVVMHSLSVVFGAGSTSHCGFAQPKCCH